MGGWGWPRGVRVPRLVCLSLFLLWAQPNKSPLSSRLDSPSNGQPLQNRGIDDRSMDDDGYRRSSLAKRGRLFGEVVKRDALTGSLLCGGEREREEASFFFPFPGEKEGKSGFCAGARAWPRWTQQGGLRWRRGASACNTAHPSPRGSWRASVPLIRHRTCAAGTCPSSSLVRPAYQCISGVAHLCTTVHANITPEPTSPTCYKYFDTSVPQSSLPTTLKQNPQVCLHSGVEWNAPARDPPRKRPCPGSEAAC